jgi:hypothetical protein
MGLFGCLTHATLKVPKNYKVEGIEQVLLNDKSVMSSANALRKSFNDFDYSHHVWFPQHGDLANV